jgi:hypothetical protein
MGVYMKPLFTGNCPPPSPHNWKEHELKLTGRDVDLISLMEKHENFTLHHEKDQQGDNIFVFIYWYHLSGADEDYQYHVETLKEEFPEWCHEFFELWEGHEYFLIG